MWDAYFCMGVCKRYVVVVIKMIPKFMSAYFLWVPIIPILRYMYVYIIDCMCINEHKIDKCVDNPQSKCPFTKC